MSTLRSILCVVVCVVIVLSGVELSRAQQPVVPISLWWGWSVQPVISVGYLWPNKPVTFSFDTSTGSLLPVQNFAQSINFQGIWTEVNIPIRTCSPVGLFIGGAYMFPIGKESDETYRLTGGVGQRSWASSVQMGHLQFGFTYLINPSINAIVGFRYDSFQTNFLSPTQLSPLSLNTLFTAGDNADISFSGYIPLLGMQVSRAITPETGIRFAALGFPALPGAFEYHETVGLGALKAPSNIPDPKSWQRMTSGDNFRSGYFLEMRGEVYTRVWGALVGSFIEFNGISGKSESKILSLVKRNANFELKELSYWINNFGTFNFERSVWILGGDITLNFDTF